MIEHYEFGKFIVNKKEFNSNIILINDVAKEARYLENHELKLEDIYPLVDSKPEVIIIGTGAYGAVKPSKSIIDFIESKGIKLIIERTEDACNTYNRLLKEGKKVAAFLHNTC